MAETTYVQDGETLDWINNTGGAVAAKDVVVIGTNGDAVIGIALVDMANGATGAVTVSGVHEVPKVDAAVIAVGEFVIWDSSAGKFDDNAATPASGDVSGGAWAIESKGATTDATIKVKLSGVPSLLTA